MSGSDIALIITAVGVLVSTVVGAVVTLRRVDGVKTEVDGVKTDVQGVHQIVNQQRTDMLAYQRTLIEALQAQGIHVPTDQSLQKK